VEPTANAATHIDGEVTFDRLAHPSSFRIGPGSDHENVFCLDCHIDEQNFGTQSCLKCHSSNNP
jgi:hypothetical protein